MLKYKKTLFVIILLLFLFLNFCNSCFAGMSLTVTDDMIADLRSIAVSKDFIIFTDANNIYGVVVPSGARVYVASGRFCNSANSFNLYTYKDSQWVSSGSHNSYDSVSSFSFWYSTCDIMNGSSGNDVFFYQTPLTLMEIMEVEERKQTIQKEMVYLVALLIGFLVSVIGLRKALAMLFQVFRQA